MISVICITYNHALYIKQTIEGFINQKINVEWEIIISDDHSTDGTQQILIEFQKKYPNNIRLFLNRKNIGIIPNFLQAFNSSKGKYIAFCEGDDYWVDKEKLKKQFEYLENNPIYSGVSGGVKLFYEMNREFALPNDLKDPTVEKDITMDLYLSGNAAYLQTLMFKKELIAPDELVFSFGDIQIQTELLRQGPIRQLSGIFTVYRKHSGGVTNSIFSSNKQKLFEELIMLFQHLNKKTSYQYDKLISKRLFDYRVCLEFSSNKKSFFEKIFSICKFLFSSYFLRNPSLVKIKTLYHAAFKDSYSWGI